MTETEKRAFIKAIVNKAKGAGPLQLLIPGWYTEYRFDALGADIFVAIEPLIEKMIDKARGRRC